MKNGEKDNIKIILDSKFSQTNKKEEEISINELTYHKLQVENAKKDNEILKLREEIQQYKKCGFDTSSSFPWPTEFKNRWVSFMHTMIMDSFDTINANYILLMRTINIIFDTIYDISKNQIRQKIIELLKCLGLQNISDINISNFYNKFQRLLFQDFFKTLFIASSDFYKSLISTIKNKIFNNKNLFKEKEIEDILKDLNNDNFPKFIREIYFLCLYMNINEPKLIIKTSTEINYRYYNKNEYDNIEGFPKNNDVCIIILNPPMIGDNKPFKGIKPAVIIIDNPSKEIIDICKEHKIYDNINNISNDEGKKELINDNNRDNYIKNEYLNFKNMNNINELSSDGDNFQNAFMTINYKINNIANYKENIISKQKRNFARTFNREEIFKMKNNPDYSLKKHIINPINFQKFIKKSEEKLNQKNLKDKFKTIHFINPQKILNINKMKIQSNRKKQILNDIDIEKNDISQNNEKKYYTESNINSSTPIAYSILDTTNNMINLVEIKKKLGLLFYSNNKSLSPSLETNKNLTNRAKRRIKPRRISNILNQLAMENQSKEELTNLINGKDSIKNNKLNNSRKTQGIENEKINNEIKIKNTCYDNVNKNKNGLYAKNSFKGKTYKDKSKKNNNFINNNLNDNINNIINSGIIMKTILNNNNNGLLNDIEEKRFIQKSNNDLKNINSIFNINNNINTNKYNNENSKHIIQEKFSLRRKINNSINIATKKDNLDNNNNNNININSINSTNNNNNISINININNSNNNNGNNFGGNVILNYDNKSSKVTKTEPDIPKKLIEKTFQKLNVIKYIANNISKNNNIKKNIGTKKNIINSNMKKLIDHKNNITESSSNNAINNTISYNTNCKKSNQINNDKNRNRISYNSVMKNQHNIIKNTNIYNLDLNSEKFKNNNKNLYNKSYNYFINKKTKLSKEKLHNKKKDTHNNSPNKRENSLKKKTISFEPISQVKSYICEKSQDIKKNSKYNNTLYNRNHNNIKDIQFDNLNKSSNSIKKYNKNKTIDLQNNINNKLIKNSDYFIFMEQNAKNKKNENKIKKDKKLENKNCKNKNIKEENKNAHYKMSSSEGITHVNIGRSHYNSKQKNYKIY